MLTLSVNRYKDKTEEVILVKNDMGLGDPKAKTYKDKVMKQLKREKCGEKNGGLVDIDLTGEGFKKDKDAKKKLLEKKKSK